MLRPYFDVSFHEAQHLVSLTWVICLLGPAVGQEPIQFILPEFMSYLGGKGVPVLMNMSNIPFEVKYFRF